MSIYLCASSCIFLLFLKKVVVANFCFKWGLSERMSSLSLNINLSNWFDSLGKMGLNFETLKKCGCISLTPGILPCEDWMIALVGMNLFVRQCYVDLFNIFLNAWKSNDDKNYNNNNNNDNDTKCGNILTRGVIFTGNPGIGKSCMLNFFFILCVKLEMTVALHQGDGLYKIYHNKRFFHSNTRLPRVLTEDQMSVILFDPSESGEFTCPPEGLKCFIVVAASPREDHYKALEKVGAVQYVLPVWTLDELKLCHPDNISEKKICNRYAMFGGIPRYLFCDDKKFQNLANKLDAAIERFDLKADTKI